MKKLNMQTKDITGGNVEKIKELFPNVITEKEGENGVIEKAVDFELLRQMLSKELVENDNERYRLDWPGKKASLLKANTPISSTLRPDRDSSVNFDTTENVYIEGDNFEVLKVLQESYLGKIKMIYIDPPYNTGTAMIYNNDFSQSDEDFEEEIGAVDEEGIKMFKNTDSNGRFHSDWLSMMYERIVVARDLLAEKGIIAIAIDDNEQSNLKNICDEIFGEANYIGVIITRCNPQGRGKINIDPVHEYHFIYCKNIESIKELKLRKINFKESYGNFQRSGTNSRKNERPKRFYPMLVNKDDIVSTIIPTEYNKIYSNENGFDEKYIKELKSKYENKGYKVVFPISKNNEEKVWQRTFDRALIECGTYIYEGGQIKVPLEAERTPTSLWLDEIYSNSAYGANKLKELFNDQKTFDYPKSYYTVSDLISFVDNDGIILDFFSGSATTAHAVMQLNTDDRGNRKFIMVQIPEKTDEGSDAYKAGYKTIPEIGRERIRRAGKKIVEENADKLKERGTPLDVGFRAYKTDTTNMKDVYYHPSAIDQKELFNQVSNIKEDRTSEDLLTQVILDLGLTLDLPIEKKKIKGNDVYFVAGNALVACFDDKIDFSIVDDIAKYEPLKVVFKDASFKEEQDRTNIETKFKRLSSETVITVL